MEKTRKDRLVRIDTLRKIVALGDTSLSEIIPRLSLQLNVRETKIREYVKLLTTAGEITNEKGVLSLKKKEGDKNNGRKESIREDIV